jgi:hypothetical protein
MPFCKARSWSEPCGHTYMYSTSTVPISTSGIKPNPKWCETSSQTTRPSHPFLIPGLLYIYLGVRISGIEWLKKRQDFIWTKDMTWWYTLLCGYGSLGLTFTFDSLLCKRTKQNSFYYNLSFVYTKINRCRYMHVLYLTFYVNSRDCRQKWQWQIIYSRVCIGLEWCTEQIFKTA